MFCALWLALAAAGVTGADQYDLIVYGGTPAGIMAAIEGRKLGMSMVLIVPDRRLGGMTTSGLGRSDAVRASSCDRLGREHRLVRNRKPLSKGAPARV